METRKVFEITGKLGNEIIKEKEKLNQLNTKCLELMDLCSHEIVFKYNDNHPRLMTIDGNYFCPACGKTVKCIYKEQLMSSPFNNSRIIPLTNLSLLGTKEVYSRIRHEVYNNIDIYYNSEIDSIELSNKMEEKLANLEIKYNDPNVTLKKTNKKV